MSDNHESPDTARPARAARWRTASDVLGQLRAHPGITRAQLARNLGLSSGSATETVARLRRLRLVTETPAPPTGRGRPTAVLRPHPEAPVVLVIELRQDGWHCAQATLDGRLHPLGSGPLAGRDPETVLAVLRRQVESADRRLAGRVRAVSVAVAGIVGDGGLLVDGSSLDWPPVELTGLAGRTGLALLVGNDATLAGVAEARSGAAAGTGTALHLIVEAGIGGVLTVDGRPLTGTGGAAGEYGHLPFGERALRCRCGAHGCWEMQVGGAALARALGEPEPHAPRGYTAEVLDRVGTDPGAARAVAASAAALGAGVAGLVNAHDPEVVTIGGLAGPLRAAAPGRFATAYTEGLMTFHRRRPPPVLDAAHGPHGARHGAAAVGLDHVTSATALADRAAR